MDGRNGSRVQPSPGGTTSRWETKASVGPAAFPRTSTRTPAASRTTPRPQPSTVSSTSRPTASSLPLTDGVATRSRSSSISAGQVNAKVGRLLLSADDHGTAARAGEHLEQECVGGSAVDDVRALDAAGCRADARLDLGTHPAGQGAARHEAGEVVGVGEGNERRGIVPVAQHA